MLRLRGSLEIGVAGNGWAESIVSVLLTSPALRTLFGLLALRLGEPVPVVDPGRLSPRRSLMIVSICRRFSARVAVGTLNYFVVPLSVMRAWLRVEKVQTSVDVPML